MAQPECLRPSLFEGVIILDLTVMCAVKLALACCTPPNALLRDLLVKELRRAGLQSKVALTVLEVATYEDYCLNTG